MNRPSTAVRPGVASSPSSTLRAASLAIMVGIAAYGFAACSAPVASNLPSISIPSIALPSGNLSACVDPATAGIISQLQQQGADVKSILTQNKDALVRGLQSFQPTDPTTVEWRDKLVAALQSSDMDAAAAQVQLLTSGQVTLSSC